MHDVGGGKVKYPQLLHQTYQEALVRNDNAHKHWEKLKEEYKTLESLLRELPNELTKEVMVPVAPRALMCGKITHTNEILVCLGQGYFVKRSASQAAAICKRREKICCDMLQALEKERELFVSRQELPLHQDAFGEREIIEIYNEEEEAQWQKEHKQKEREYRQKLAELREKEKTAVVDEKSLWQRLDELELEEELEEELDRLHAEESDEETEEMDEEKEESESEIEKDNLTKQDSVSDKILQTRASSSRRVSFAAVEDGNAEEELRIEFHHSNVPAINPTTDPAKVKFIQSPAELYMLFKGQFLSEPKSILKKTSSYDADIDNAVNDESQNEPMEEQDSPCDLSPTEPLPPPVMEQVMERGMTMNNVQPPVERRVSRFKALRKQMKWSYDLTNK